jgi:putative transposase
MDEYQTRKEAITRYLNGDKVSRITRSLNRSRQWFYYWLDRFKTGNTDWFSDLSKAPKHIPIKIDAKTEQLVISIRKQLESTPYAQIGPISIQYEFYRLGLKPPPPWTINRIIARHGMNKPVARSRRCIKEYPELFIHTHQLDLVGPRYLKGDGRFFSVNMIDTCSHSCYVKPVRCKSSDEVLQTVVECWQTQGMPDAIQMDNELAFRGSNRHPRSFGSIIRFALSQGVAPVFIPIKEPWRNGMIERFNHTYDQRFIKGMIFQNFEHLVQCSEEFISFHNNFHRYSSQQHKTPVELREQLTAPILYKGSTHLMKRIPLETGSVYFIRFIRSDLQLRLITEYFKVNESLKYCYVVAEINIDNQCLNVRLDNQILQTFEYRIPVDW